MAYPERIETGAAPLDLAAQGRLDFEAADRDRFPCLALAEAAMQAGGLAPTVLNAANEEAVAAFLDGRIGFADIAGVVDACLNTADSAAENAAAAALEAVFEADRAARDAARIAIAGKAAP